MLLKKLSQLEEAWAQKEKFIHSSRMIVKFREDHICRLEKKLKAGQSSLSDTESYIDQLKEEITILKDQVKRSLADHLHMPVHVHWTRKVLLCPFQG